MEKGYEIVKANPGTAMYPGRVWPVDWKLKQYSPLACDDRIDLKAWFFAAPVLVMALVILSVILLLSVRVFRMKLAKVLISKQS